MLQSHLNHLNQLEIPIFRWLLNSRIRRFSCLLRTITGICKVTFGGHITFIDLFNNELFTYYCIFTSCWHLCCHYSAVAWRHISSGAALLNLVFTRDSIYAIARICYRPSVRPSVTRVYHRKTAEDRIMKFSPYGSPIPLVFRDQVLFRNCGGFPHSAVLNEGGGR